MEFVHYKCFIIIIIIACNVKKGAVLKGPWSASCDKKDVRME